MTYRRKLGYAKTPAKGTQRREALLLAMRPCGVAVADLSYSLGMWLTIRNETAWDVRVVGRRAGVTKPTHIVRVVGVHRWGGRYRDLTGPSRT